MRPGAVGVGSTVLAWPLTADSRRLCGLLSRRLPQPAGERASPGAERRSPPRKNQPVARTERYPGGEGLDQRAAPEQWPGEAAPGERCALPRPGGLEDETAVRQPRAAVSPRRSPRSRGLEPHRPGEAGIL